MARRTIKIRWGRWEDTPGGRRYVRYAPGDPVELSDEEAAGFPPGRLGPVESSSAATASPETEAIPPAGTVREIEERLSEIAEPAAVSALAVAELASPLPRKGVLRAVEARLAELGFGPDGEPLAVDEEESEAEEG